MRGSSSSSNKGKSRLWIWTFTSGAIGGLLAVILVLVFGGSVQRAIAGAIQGLTPGLIHLALSHSYTVRHLPQQRLTFRPLATIGLLVLLVLGFLLWFESQPGRIIVGPWVSTFIGFIGGSLGSITPSVVHDLRLSRSQQR